MAQIKRVEMKKMVKPMLTKALLTMFQSKACEHKHMKLDLKAYQHSGLSARLDHFSFGVMVNIIKTEKSPTNNIAQTYTRTGLLLSNLLNTMMISKFTTKSKISFTISNKN